MGWIKKLREAGEQIKQIVEEEAPRPAPAPPPPPAPKPKKDESKFVRGLAERIGYAGLIAFTVGAALFGAVGCNEEAGTPAPRPPYSEDADKPDYRCGYDGNQRCPSTPPVTKASCEEPAAWCHRGDAAEVTR